MLVTYCCLLMLIQTQQLTIAHILYLKGGFFVRLQPRCWPGLQSHLRLPWGKVCFLTHVDSSFLFSVGPWAESLHLVGCCQETTLFLPFRPRQHNGCQLSARRERASIRRTSSLCVMQSCASFHLYHILLVSSKSWLIITLENNNNKNRNVAKSRQIKKWYKALFLVCSIS